MTSSTAAGQIHDSVTALQELWAKGAFKYGFSGPGAIGERTAAVLNIISDNDAAGKPLLMHKDIAADLGVSNSRSQQLVRKLHMKGHVVRRHNSRATTVFEPEDFAYVLEEIEILNHLRVYRRHAPYWKSGEWKPTERLHWEMISKGWIKRVQAYHHRDDEYQVSELGLRHLKNMRALR